MQARLERLEKETAAMRSRESTKLAVQAAVLKKAARRASSPLHPLSAGKGGRRALSPLASSARRHPRSPGSESGGTTSFVYAADATDAATAVTAAPEVLNDEVACAKPPPPPSPPVEEDCLASEQGASSTTLAALAATGSAALAAAAGAIGATPAARAARSRRRSSVGSTGTDALTPTRRSARLANKMASVTQEA